jgi:tRNA A-37 threonylcarbamoyl transferase component Bud32
VSEDRDAETAVERPTAPAQRRIVQIPVASRERYRPVREIARGGMGRVLEAVDVSLARTVALKEMLDAHPQMRARFEREVEITARLEHPSIVPLYDAGVTESGAPFYVMRKVSGEPFDKLIREASSLDRRLTLLPHVLAVANAVAHAHARGVIHRDIKPSNVIVGELGETIVIDWGLAKVVDEEELGPPVVVEQSAGESLHTLAGTMIGTPGYMPPEQVAGETADARADVYALGASLYQVLAGKPPFHGLTEQEVLDRTRDGAPDALPAIVPGVPPDLVTIVEKAMAREPARRYLDAGGLAEDLRRFLGGQLVASHHYPIRARIARWVARHRVAVAVVALAAITLAAVGAVSLRRIVVERSRAESALARERERSEELIVARASSYLETDPTLAAASLAQLPATSPRWRALGPTVEAIRARGVARGYRGTGQEVSHVELAPDRSHRVLVSGRGIALLHDLVRRTTTTIAAEDGMPAVRWAGGLIVIDGNGNDTVLDPRTGTRTPAPWPGGASLSIDRRGVVAAVADGRLGLYEPLVRDSLGSPAGAGAPVVIDVGEPIATAVISASGRWLAARSAKRVHLLREDSGRLGYVEVATIGGEIETIVFDAAEHRLAVAGPGGPIRVLRYEGPAPRELRELPTDAVSLPVFVGSQLFVMRLGAQLERVDTGERMPQFGRVPFAASGDAVALTIGERVIRVDTGAERHDLRAPEDIHALAADERFLVAATRAHVLVWDLDELRARRVRVGAGNHMHFIDDWQLAAVSPRDVGETVGLHRFRIEPSSLALAAQDRVDVPSEAFVDGFHRLITIRDARGVSLLGATRVAVEDVPGITNVIPLDDSAVLAGTAGGQVHRIARTSGRSLGKLVELARPIDNLATSGGWIAARTEGGTVWRRDPQGGETRTTVEGSSGLAIATDGTVYLCRDNEMLEWTTTRGAPVVVRAGGNALVSATLRVVSARSVVVQAKDRSVHRFDRQRRTFHQVLVSVSTLALAEHAPAAAGVIGDAFGGELVVADLDSGEAWRLAAHVSIAVGGLAISRDGQTIATAWTTPRGTETTLHVWRRGERPPRAWIEDATNATPPTSLLGATEWRLP